MYVRFLKRYAIIPMIEVEFAAPLIAIGYDSSTRSAVRLQPVQGLMQVQRHESNEYLYVEPVKAVSLEVEKRCMNSPDELVHGIAHSKKPESQPTKQQCRPTRYTTNAGKNHFTTDTPILLTAMGMLVAAK